MKCPVCQLGDIICWRVVEEGLYVDITSQGIETADTYNIYVSDLPPEFACSNCSTTFTERQLLDTEYKELQEAKIKEE